MKQKGNKISKKVLKNILIHVLTFPIMMSTTGDGIYKARFSFLIVSA